MNDKIRELMDELRNECMLAKVPMFVVVGNEVNGKSEYESRIITPLYIGKTLSDDRISPLDTLLSKKFRLEFSDEPRPEDIEASIADALYGEPDQDAE